MKISFKNSDKINGLLTLTIDEADYKEKVEKELKNRRKTAQMPGFRPGQVPMSLIQRHYALPVKMDIINNMVGQEIYKYIGEKKIQMLGEPLPSDKQKPQDLEKDGPLTFVFDIAVAPEINLTLDENDKLKYYTISVDDKLVEDQISMLTARSGKYEKAEAYSPEERDILKGDLRETGKENGLVLADVQLMPQYISVEEQKALFNGAKVGDIITWNPRKAYPENDAELTGLLKVKKEELAEHEGDFTFQVTEISRFTKHAIDQELFDQVYGKDAVKTEEAFRKRVTDDLKKQMEPNSDFRLLTDLREYCEKKVGELKFPEEILKRVMLNNNKDKGADYVEKNFEGSIKELGWHLMKEKLVEQFAIKLEDNDLLDAAKEAIKMQFAQYGMTNVPDEDLAQYAQNMLKERDNVQQYADRAIDKKLIEKVKETVKLTKKKVTLDEFNKLYEK